MLLREQVKKGEEWSLTLAKYKSLVLQAVCHVVSAPRIKIPDRHNQTDLDWVV